MHFPIMYAALAPFNRKQKHMHEVSRSKSEVQEFWSLQTGTHVATYTHEKGQTILLYNTV